MRGAPTAQQLKRISVDGVNVSRAVPNAVGDLAPQREVRQAFEKAHRSVVRPRRRRVTRGFTLRAVDLCRNIPSYFGSFPIIPLKFGVSVVRRGLPHLESIARDRRTVTANGGPKFGRPSLRRGARTSCSKVRGAHSWMPGRRNGLPRGILNRVPADNRFFGRAISSGVQICLGATLKCGGVAHVVG